jgi:transcriptional regulator with XRE-family HTH domain
MPRSSSADPLETFGKRVRARRIARGLSQEAAAHEAGIHPTYWSSIERGRRNVALINTLRIAKALKIDPGVLIKNLKP